MVCTMLPKPSERPGCWCFNKSQPLAKVRWRMTFLATDQISSLASADDAIDGAGVGQALSQTGRLE